MKVDWTMFKKKFPSALGCFTRRLNLLLSDVVKVQTGEWQDKL